jgi:hypothetical protein
MTTGMEQCISNAKCTHTIVSNADGQRYQPWRSPGGELLSPRRAFFTIAKAFIPFATRIYEMSVPPDLITRPSHELGPGIRFPIFLFPSMPIGASPRIFRVCSSIATPLHETFQWNTTHMTTVAAKGWIYIGIATRHGLHVGACHRGTH